jgi:hypothetical protein
VSDECLQLLAEQGDTFFSLFFFFFLLCQVNASQFWLNSETRTWANATTAPMHAAVDLRDFSAQANKYRERIL